MDNGQIILFQTQGGETKIEVRLSNETVWGSPQTRWRSCFSATAQLTTVYQKNLR